MENSKREMDKINKIGIEKLLDQSLKNQEFQVFYQPKYDSYSEKMVSAEALVRWRRNGEWILPDQFIRCLEENKDITKLDLYMIEEVCKKQRQFLNQGVEPIPISVNFSVMNLYKEETVEELIQVLKKYGIESRLIELEFTEGVFIKSIDRILPVIYLLKHKGFSITLDDFGYGYSSLALLKELPLDIVKLDKNFFRYSLIENTAVKEKGEYIVKKIIELCKDLKITIVAEGIETKEQLDFLRICQCDIIQGYLFSRPLIGEEFDKYYLGH